MERYSQQLANEDEILNSFCYTNTLCKVVIDVNEPIAQRAMEMTR